MEPIAAPAAAQAQPPRDESTDDESSAQILSYLAAVRPLRGCCYCDHDHYQRGRSLIERMAAYGEHGLQLTPTDCADVISFLHSVEPLEPGLFFEDPDSGPSHWCGLNLILENLEQALRGVASEPAGRA